MSRQHSEDGARARRARRMERRMRHFVALAEAAVETQLAAAVAGVSTLGELEPESNAFARAARAVIDDPLVTDSDLEALGLREDPDGGLWLRVGPAWGRG